MIICAVIANTHITLKSFSDFLVSLIENLPSTFFTIMPPSSKVCRVCLSVDVTMCRIADTPLQAVYEKLTNRPLHSTDKPIEACYICYADLNKCHMVMVNAVKADNVLTALLERSVKVKNKSVSLSEHRTNSPVRPQSPKAACVDTAPSSVVEIKSEEELQDNVEMEYEVLEDRETEEQKPESPRNMFEIHVPPRNNIKKHVTPRKNIEKQESPRNNTEIHVPSRNIRRENGEKPIECHICKCTFKHMSNLKKHLTSHSGVKYKCNLCQRIFSSKGNFKVHIRTHNGEKPLLKCDSCQYITTSKVDLERHTRSHRKRVSKYTLLIKGLNK